MKYLQLITVLLFCNISFSQTNETIYLKKALEARENNDTISFKAGLKSFEILLNNNINSNSLDDATLYDYASVIYFAGVDNINIGENAFKKALPYVEKCASSGNYDCNFYLSYMYQFGKGVEVDKEKAKEFLDKAILGGKKEAAAKNNLGVYYASIKDYQNAFKYYNLSALMGYGLAYSNIGWLFYEGRGVEKDYKKSIDYFKLGELNGDKSKSFALGLGHCYSLGYGTNIDFEKGLQYYRIAVSENKARAFARIGYMFKLGQGLNKNIDSAYYYFERGAVLGDRWANFQMGVIGHFYYKDCNICKPWDIERNLKNAIESGYDEAKLYLAQEYIKNRTKNDGTIDYGDYSGEDVKFLLLGAYNNIIDKDLKVEVVVTMAHLVTKSEMTFYGGVFNLLLTHVNDDKDGNIENFLGIFYLNGFSVKKSKSKAASYFGKAINKGNKFAVENLKLCN